MARSFRVTLAVAACCLALVAFFTPATTVAATRTVLAEDFTATW